MKRKSTTVIGLAIVLATGGAAMAQGKHDHASKAGMQDKPGMMQGMMMQQGDIADDGMMPMMQMHRQMHAGMHGQMPGQMMNHGMMGGVFRAALDGDGDGTVTPEEARGRLQTLLEENDADGDGTLNLMEFEALHSRLIRERTVDRFQHLDANGDGAITAEEMRAPADKLERMQNMHRMKTKPRVMMDDAAPQGDG